MRRIIVAGNWKMYKTCSEASTFISELVGKLQTKEIEVVIPIIAAPALYLEKLVGISAGSELRIAAQDVSKYQFGAYTGEVSASMLASVRVKYCLIGHSERRQYHRENDQEIREKLLCLEKHQIIPIICIGEREEEREAGLTSKVIIDQLSEIFSAIQIDDPERYIIAYEPVWAIGTGKTATPQMAQEVHYLIREWLTENYSSEIATRVVILYGGSVKPDNFADLLNQPDIDGGLIGGASLNLEDYWNLLQTAIKITNEEI